MLRLWNSPKREMPAIMYRKHFTVFIRRCRNQTPKAWLYRTLRNLCISQIRKQKRLQMEGEEKQLDFFSAEANPEAAEGNPLEKLEKSEQILIMKHHLSLLPQEDLNLLVLKFEKKMSYAQISEALGISSGNVGYKLHHLIRDLSQSMKLEDIG